MTRGARAGIFALVTLASIWFLKSASGLLVPIAIAVLIACALEPVVAWMSRHGIPRIAGACALVATLVGISGWGLYTLRDDALAATEALPQAARRIREMVTQPRSRAATNIRQAVRELNSAAAGGAAADHTPQTATAPSVSSTGSATVLQKALEPIFTIAGDITVVVFLVLFLLLGAPRLNTRILEVAGDGRPERRRKLETIMTEATAQIQRFLLVRAVTASLVAAATWMVLAWMAVGQAAVWAILAGVFNSIPYFGPVIVSGGLFLVGLIQESATRGMAMAGAALAITTLEGWIVTPLLLGKAERMDAVVVFLGLLLWTWLWGAWGTILAVPMLAVIKAVAEQTTALRPLARLMSR